MRRADSDELQLGRSRECRTWWRRGAGVESCALVRLGWVGHYFGVQLGRSARPPAMLKQTDMARDWMALAVPAGLHTATPLKGAGGSALLYLRNVCLLNTPHVGCVLQTFNSVCTTGYIEQIALEHRHVLHDQRPTNSTRLGIVPSDVMSTSLGSMQRMTSVDERPRKYVLSELREGFQQ
jgi:hypothetical protein